MSTQLSSVLCGFTVLTLCTASLAQTADTPESANRRVLEEVLVTAQKRSQRNVEVGINVTGLSGDDLKNVRIDQVRDIAAYVPNMDIKEQVPGAIPVVTIRGVGLEDFSTTNSPAAGVYVDEVPLSSLALMSFDLYDMERLEVLKGPQGTLYGRNSTAGALNIVTAKPSQEWEGYLKLGKGSYRTREAELTLNVPLHDTLALRLAGKAVRQDEGFWTSRFAAGEAPGAPGLPGMLGLPDLSLSAAGNSDRDFGKRDIDLGRAQLRWEPTEDFRLNLKVDRILQRSEMGQPEFFGQSCAPGSQPIDPENCTDLFGYTDADGDPYTGDWADEFPYEIDQTSRTATADMDFGVAALTWVVGYIDFERFFHIDADATPRDQFNFIQADAAKQLTHELRLAGSMEIVDWLFGVFWSRDQVEIDTEGRHQELIPGLASQITADQETVSKAAFLNLDWHLLDNLVLITGLRYTSELRKYEGGSDWTMEVPGTIEDTYTNDEIRDSNYSWKLGLNYSPTTNSLLYASAAKGTKSGGYFAGVTTAQNQLEPYLPESLVSYELGAKLQGVVTVNASLFHYDYENVQTFMRAPPAPVQFIGNVPESTIYGAEIDLFWLPLERLTVQAGLGYLKTELGGFVGPNGDEIPEGNEMPNSPAKTANLLLRYEMPIWRTSLSLAWQGDIHYSDSTFKEATNDTLITADSYSVVNARISLLPERRHWELSLWGKNLREEEYVVQGLNVGVFAIGNRNYNAPKTYGVELSYHYF